MRDCTKCMPSKVSSSAAIVAKSVEPVTRFAKSVEQHHDQRAEDDVEKAPAVGVVAVGHMPDDGVEDRPSAQPVALGMPPKSMIESVISSLLSGGCVFS